MVAEVGPSPMPRSTDAAPTTGRGVRAVVGARTFTRAVVEVLPAWLVARVVVVAVLGMAHATVGTFRPGNPGALARVQQGLLAWDGGWYESIARHGYAGAGLQSVRFFPLFPFAAKVIGWVPGVGVGAAVVLVANLCALVAMAALVLLVRHDFGDAALARRSAWLLALAPSAYTLVLGYADAALLLCTVGCLLTARTGRWWWAAAAGLCAGGVRPLGVLLVVPVAIELVRVRHADLPGTAGGAARWTPRVAARGRTGRRHRAFLGWVGARFGDFWLPLRVQEQSGHRGALALPFARCGTT